jgi:hypothetical protein
VHQLIQELQGMEHDSPPYTFFLLNGDMELHRDWQIFV